MKTRPILFSAPMVLALLDGTKTQTRRLVKPQPPTDFNLQTHKSEAGWIYAADYSKMTPVDTQRIRWECPHGQPMDKLWVRETWCGKVDPLTSILMWNEDGNTYQCYYKADGEHVTLDDGDGFTATRKDGSEASPWRPSIFMPRWASRITLEITGVRVERLQDISRGDAMLEGCPFQNMAQGDDPRQWYAGLWDQINGPSSWDANPFVWVLEFRRVEQ